MARPRKSADDRASSAFQIRLTEAQRRQLEAKAAAGNISITELVRVAALDYKPPPRRMTPATPETVTLWREVHALGINMNQIAYHLNATGELDNVPELRELCREIRAVFARIMAL
jgi:hypothetical protein